MGLLFHPVFYQAQCRPHRCFFNGWMRKSLMRHKKKGRKEIGKKAVYMTEFRNAAIEMKKMYERKGIRVAIEIEKSHHGVNIFVVYVFLGDTL